MGGNYGNLYYSENGGTDWRLETTFSFGTNFLHVLALSGTGTNSIWAVVGSSGPYDSNRIYHYNGSSWSVQTTIALQIFDIAATGEGSVWAGAYAGTILRYDGSNWSIFTDVGNPSVNTVAAQNDKAWAGLSSGAILYFNGSAWSVETLTPSSQGIDEIRVSPAGEVWAGAHYGVIYRRSIRPPRSGYTTLTGTGPATSPSSAGVPASGRSGG